MGHTDGSDTGPKGRSVSFPTQGTMVTFVTWDVLTDAIWNFIKNKVHPHLSNVGTRRKAMQRLFFPQLGLAQHPIVFGAIFIIWFLCRPVRSPLSETLHEQIGERG